jgi:hypothetical protein
MDAWNIRGIDKVFLDDHVVVDALSIGIARITRLHVQPHHVTGPVLYT